MFRSVRWLSVLLVLAGCRQTRSEAGRDQRPDLAQRTGSAELQDNEAGLEFDAPRLIPAIRAQINEIEDPDGATEGNLTALKNGVGTLVNAMEADLHRVGVTDTGHFYELGDSVMRAIGGGAGTEADLSPEGSRQVTDQVERLIGIYQQRMRTARD
jgi:hypothetical protein